MPTIKEYFEQAQLSMAAYAVLFPGMSGSINTPEYVDALRIAGMSESQAREFADTYRVLAQSPESGFFDSGFSATVFQHVERGEINIAIRGSQFDFNDWVGSNFGDIGANGIAISQGIALFNWLQRLVGAPGEDVVQYTYLPSRTDEITGEIIPARLEATTAKASGELEALSGSVVVSGHSLGGHLAMMLSRLAPDLVSAVYSYNSPGFDVLGTGLTSEGFFELLRDAPADPITGDIATSWNGSIMVHAVVDGDIVHNVGNTPGTQEIIFSEMANQGIIDAHGIEEIADSLALHDLFAKLDPVLNSATLAVAEITDVLEATASDPAKSLEHALDAVRRILLGSDIAATPLGNSISGRDQFYKNYFSLLDPEHPDNAAFSAVAGNAALRTLVGEPQSELQALAQMTGPGGLAYRYALRELNPFALLGADYAIHNAAGELDLYKADSRTGTLTARWLEDRAAFLHFRIIANTQDNESNGRSWVFHVGPIVHFEDRREGGVQHLYLGPGSAVVNEPSSGMTNVLFGGQRLDDLLGGNHRDRLYGDDGNDLLLGAQGDDRLEGGRGRDTYRYRFDDGRDTILDVDGRGRILYTDAEGDEWFLSGGRQVGEAENLYISTLDPAVQYRREIDGDLVINIAGNDAITIDNYRPGDLGITLEDARGILLNALGPIRPEEEWQNVLRGDQSPNLNDDLTADPSTAVIQGGAGDDLLSGRSGQDGYVQAIQIHGGEGADVIHGEIFYTSRFYDIGQEAFEAEQGQLEAGAGAIAFGEAGNDRFLGSLRDDNFDGGHDHDFADAYLGNDVLIGQDGNDLLNGDEGADDIRGDTGDDRLGGGAGSDYLRGGDGSDQIYGDSTYRAGGWDGTNLTLVFGSLETARLAIVADVVEQEAGADMLDGGAGSDELYGGAGHDVLDGEADSDLLQGEGGDDLLFGGAGNDRLFGDSSVDAEANDNADVTTAGSYTYYWRARQVGPDGNDYIDAGEGDDTAWGGGGDDYLFGGAGDDDLLGGLFDGSTSGDDILEGGAGADRLYGEDGGDNYRFARGDGFDFVFDTSGFDRAVFGEDILPGDIAVRASRTDAFNLVLQVADTAETLTFYNWFDPAERIESVEFADGTTWDADYLLSRARLITAAADISDPEGTDTTYEAFLGRDLAEGFALSIADAGGDDVLRFNPVVLSNTPLGPVYLNPTLEGLVREGDDLVLDIRLSSGSGTDVQGSARLIEYFGSGQIDQVMISDSRELVAPDIVSNIPGVYLLTSASAPLYERFNVNNSYFGISSVVYTGTDGTDTLSPISGLGGVRSTYYGNGGDDLLIGTRASDTLIGGSGADRMEGKRGSDAYHIDPAAADVVLDDEFGYSFSSTDTLVLPAGISLADVTFGREGDDLLIGNVRIERYFERDFAEIGFDDYPYKIERLEGDGFEVLDLGGHLVSLGLFGHYTGTDADNTLNGDQFNNTVEAGGGDDLINGGKGDDAISGGEGDDTLFGEGTFRGRSETDNDRIDGGAGNDYLQGDGGEDTLLGGGGNDVLYADEGYAALPDWATGRIFIDYGGDTLAGGAGNDVLYGEQDGDTYGFGQGDGVDVVQDWGYDRWNNDHTYLGETLLELERAVAGLTHLEGAIFRSSRWRGIFREHRIEAALPADLGSGLEAIDEGVAPASAIATLTQLREWLIEDQLDIVAFGTGIAPEDLVVEVLPRELQIDVGGGDHLLIRDPDGASNYGIERFRFADGGELTLVGMMALDESIDHDMEVEGTFADNLLAGGNGDDLLDGRGGSDILIGGAGDDFLFGGYSDTDEFGPVRNADVLEGGLGNDYMDGEDGADTYIIRAAEGVDRIDDGSDGYDTTEIDSDIADLGRFEGQTYTNEHWPREIRDWGVFPMPQALASAVDALEHGVAPSLALQTLTELRAWFIAQETDVIEFGEGVAPESISIRWNDSGEFLIGIGENHGVQVEGVERFRFADGRELIAEHMRDLGQQVFDEFGEIDGTESADVLVGYFIDDEISGDEGDDLLLGRSGDDEISGGGGNDILVGGKGLEWGDWAEGGAGSDVYLFNRADIIANTDIVDELNVDFVVDSASDPVANDIDTLSFGADIRPEDLDAFVDVFVDGSESSIMLGLMLHDTQQAILIDWSYDDGEGGFESYAIERMQFLGHGNDRVFDLAGLVEARFNELTQASEQAPLALFTPEALAAFDIADHADPAGGQYAINYAITGDVFTAPPNSAPTVANPIIDQSAAEDTPFSFQVPVDAFSDVGGGELSYGAKLSRGSELPAWLTFDPTTRAFAGMPGNSDVGSIDIRISATDTGGLSAFDDFTLSVNNVNDTPVVATNLADQAAAEDTPFSLTVPADAFADVDVIHGDMLAYGASLADGAALPAWLSFDAVTREFSGTPGNADVGDFDIRVTAADASGASVFDDFILSVANVNDAPVLVAPIEDQSAMEDAPFSFSVPAGAFADIDAVHGDTLTYTATLADGSALPAWLAFDPVAATFTGAPTNEDVGELEIAITAIDAAGASASDVFGLMVHNINDAPVLAAPLTGQAVNEYDVFTYELPPDTFTDPDTIHGDTLAYTATLADGSPLPEWLAFDPTTRTFTGTPTLSERGAHEIRVQAADAAGASASAVFTLSVLAVGNGVSGDAGTDILSGTAGDDVIAAGADFDLLSGNRGNDILDAGEGSDILLGGSGDDRLLGGAGDDLLYGGSGDNRLQGGAGDDLLAGGNGADTYVFHRGDGRDTVLALGNPRAASDTLELGVDPLEILFSETWGRLQVELYPGDDRLDILGWNARANQLESIVARDGSTLLNNQVEQLIQAMNQFSADNGGITWEQAIAERPQDVEAVLAAYWQPAAA